MQDELLQLWDDDPLHAGVRHPFDRGGGDPSARASWCCRRIRARCGPSSTAPASLTTTRRRRLPGAASAASTTCCSATRRRAVNGGVRDEHASSRACEPMPPIRPELRASSSRCSARELGDVGSGRCSRWRAAVQHRRGPRTAVRSWSLLALIWEAYARWSRTIRSCFRPSRDTMQALVGRASSSGVIARAPRASRCACC